MTKRRAALLATYFESYDTAVRRLGHARRSSSTRTPWNMHSAHAKSEPKQAAMARATLTAALALIDPVWGGVYQYSDQRDWKSPHFEKIMSFQAQYMRLYAQAYRLLGDPAYLQAAQSIDRYVEHFLTSPDGVVYTSQDADVDDALTGHVFYAMSDASGGAIPIRISTRTSTPAKTAGPSVPGRLCTMRPLMPQYLRAGASRGRLGERAPRARLAAASATASARLCRRRLAIPSRWGRGFSRSTPQPASAVGLRRRARRRASSMPPSSCPPAAMRRWRVNAGAHRRVQGFGARCR